MNVCILAGGFGTRLASVVSDVPKPLAPIGAKVFLEIILEQLADYDIKHVVICLHHKADMIIDWFQSYAGHTALPFTVAFEVEDTPLDTGGAVKNCCVKHDLSGQIIIMNADTFIAADLQDIIASDSNVLGLISQTETARFGGVTVNEANQITGFVEKSDAPQDYVYCGMCNIAVSDICAFEQDRFSLERDVFTRLAAQRALKAVPLSGLMTDIGVPADYHRFCEDYRG